MSNQNNEKHLDVYKNRYELHQDGKTTVFLEGNQNHETQERYALLNKELANGFLERVFNSVQSIDFSKLSKENRVLLNSLVNGITSEVGRALVGLAFLQLTIKSITPSQSIRLHKGATRKGSFSWVDGISMRTIDSKYNTPFLREHGLLKLNKYGLFMTRSLAENYPYTSLYKADMRGPFDNWIAIVDAIENDIMPPKLSLCYMMALLRNRSDKFCENANKACLLVENHKNDSFDSICNLLIKFFNNTGYSARAFEVTMHGLFQAMYELQMLGDVEVVPLSQMRSANKKHGNIGDIELTDNGMICESWDAKYGKPYLRDELEELQDKLLLHPDCKVAGFVVDSSVDLRNDIVARKNEIEAETRTEIHLFSFKQWVQYETLQLNESSKNRLGYQWLKSVVESFAQRRHQIAPIDEPCDAWISDLISILNNA